MKNKFLLATVSVLSAVALVACSTHKKESRKPLSSESSSTEVVKKSKKSSSKKTSSKVESKSSDDTKSDTKSSVETKRVGSPDYGYIDIPSKWIKFTDIDGGDSIQFTDGSAYNIVTMNGYTKEKANVGEGEVFNAELIANRLAYYWNDNKELEKMWGAKTTVSGNEALQLNIILKSGQYLITWVFQKDDKVYLMSFEGDKETLAQFIPYIEETWSLDEKGPKA
ncbi:hypothetical protein LXO72_02600 [Streptococcus sp. XMC]|uniref:hypothetical protein n=1 Tax=Streptococcus sp. XMC TaxID=2905972 RepID=UPI001E46DB66|nr:hypothetical protein [Streptococcus sp. XMC]MCE3591286.1 hypothetical protein [Streptococcus sp. XMC]